MATIPLLHYQHFAGLSQQWQLGFLGLLSFMAVSTFLLLTSSRSRNNSTTARKRLSLPPGPAQMPILGNLHQLGSLPHRSLRELARRYGPVMLLRLGTVPAVVVSSAEAAREMLKAYDADCCSRPASPGARRLTYGLKDVAFAPHGEHWREARRLLVAELLSTRRVRAACRAREEQVEKMVGDLRRLGPEQAVALDGHVFALADGIIGTVAFGNVYGSERFAHNKERFQQVLREAMAVLAGFSAEDFFPNAAGRLLDRVTGLVARCEGVFAELDAFFETVIDQHTDPARAKPEHGGDLVDVLVTLWKENGGGTLQFTRDHVKAIILDTFLGGIDTSSATILWAMSELVRNPRALRKAQAEVRAVVGDGSGGNGRVRQDDVSKLAYLKMVVKETLRLHPPATLLLPRETIRDINISGHDVPTGTRVLVNAWAIGRDPASWGGAAAEEFDPGRFEGSGGVDYGGARFELVPFGAGRRVCPGMAMGVANVEFALASLLYSFDWALPEGVAAEDVSMEEAGGLTFHRKTPLVLVPSKYDHRAL